MRGLQLVAIGATIAFSSVPVAGVTAESVIAAGSDPSPHGAGMAVTAPHVPTERPVGISLHPWLRQNIIPPDLPDTSGTAKRGLRAFDLLIPAAFSGPVFYAYQKRRYSGSKLRYHHESVTETKIVNLVRRDVFLKKVKHSKTSNIGI